jgi:predicted nucleic acid-binding protein
MFDTDTCAFILRRTSAELLDRIQKVPLENQSMSVVTLAELLYGVQVSAKKKGKQDRCRHTSSPRRSLGLVARGG